MWILFLDTFSKVTLVSANTGGWSTSENGNCHISWGLKIAKVLIALIHQLVGILKWHSPWTGWPCGKAVYCGLSSFTQIILYYNHYGYLTFSIQVIVNSILDEAWKRNLAEIISVTPCDSFELLPIKMYGFFIFTENNGWTRICSKTAVEGKQNKDLLLSFYVEIKNALKTKYIIIKYFTSYFKVIDSVLILLLESKEKTIVESITFLN